MNEMIEQALKHVKCYLVNNDNQMIDLFDVDRATVGFLDKEIFPTCRIVFFVMVLEYGDREHLYSQYLSPQCFLFDPHNKDIKDKLIIEFVLEKVLAFPRNTELQQAAYDRLEECLRRKIEEYKQNTL